MATAAYPLLSPGGYPVRTPSASLSSRCYHTGGVGPIGGVVGTNTASGNDTAGANTMTFVTEILIMHTCLVSGIAVKNGSVAGTDKLCAALLDGAQNVLAQSDPAGATASGTSAYQALAFVGGPIQLRPGIYYVAEQANGTTTRIATHTVGAFGAKKTTAGGSANVFGKFDKTNNPLTIPVTFTANEGAMASLY